MRSTTHILVLATIIATTIFTGCAVHRTAGPGRPLGSYDYAVLSQEGSGEYYSTASSMLGQHFVVLDESDERLALPSVRPKACTVSVGWSPGFWSTSGWVEIKDYAHATPVHTSHMRRGMLWIGAHADVMDALRDVAAARAAGPAVPASAREPMPEAATPPETSRSTAQRLEELNNLRARGLISESEYSAQRKAIIQNH